MVFEPSWSCPHSLSLVGERYKYIIVLLDSLTTRTLVVPADLPPGELPESPEVEFPPSSFVASPAPLEFARREELFDEDELVVELLLLLPPRLFALAVELLLLLLFVLPTLKLQPSARKHMTAKTMLRLVRDLWFFKIFSFYFCFGAEICRTSPFAGSAKDSGAKYVL